ncbi:putative pyruvate formate lyase activating enzyme [Desulfonauticus submarinus]|uniref:Putative pyruvate formate lyase activating enzyme n=1 Tax=Desulfonauticus submarinus TaxID=206665 RepID=A0A1G9ZPC9_9BACT|nr:radical SAM protein [Desulfonauticus submarinus]SDN22937.1 putative pyruvate formate lyase activating enzyme [Desulfonauticus submarinus]
MNKNAKTKAIQKIIPWFKKNLQNCNLCPRNCKVNRLKQEKGFCKTLALSQVASFNLHFGEEDILVGQKGSGTIFFAHCNLGCVFCQNHEISQTNSEFQTMHHNQLAYIMLKLQKKGAHNINLVTPSHVVYAILKALEIALQQGLSIPIVYNTSSFDGIKTLKKLKNIVDIYLADIKFFSRDKSQKYCNAKNYSKIAKQNILEMYEQVGGIKLKNNIANKGLIIRHLVLPNNLSETEKWLFFLHKHKLHNIYLNIMSQYYPHYLADKYPELNQSVSYETIAKYINLAKKMGFKYIDNSIPKIFKFIKIT